MDQTRKAQALRAGLLPASLRDAEFQANEFSFLIQKLNKIAFAEHLDGIAPRKIERTEGSDTSGVPLLSSTLRGSLLHKAVPIIQQCLLLPLLLP